MSFSDGRRYGHVPPAQYPVRDETLIPNRRPSFSSGDEAAFLERSRAHSVQAQGQGFNAQGYHANAAASTDDLFVSSPVETSPSRSRYGSLNPEFAGGQQQQYQSSPQLPSSQFARSPTVTPSSHMAPTRSGSTLSRFHTSAGSSPPIYNPAAYALVNQRQSTYTGHNPYGPQQYSHINTITSPIHGPLSPSTAFSPTFSGLQSPFHPQPPQQPAYEPNYNPFSSSATQSPHSPFEPTFASQLPPPPPPPPVHAGHSLYGGAQVANGGSPGPVPYPDKPSPQLPYPLTSLIPVGPNYDPSSYSNRVARSGSQSSSASSSGQQPAAGILRHPTNAPLPSRPMDDVPEESPWESNGNYDIEQEHRTQEDLMGDIEAELTGAPQVRLRPSPFSATSEDESRGIFRYNSTSTTTVVSRNASSATSNTMMSRSNVPPLPKYEDGDESGGGFGDDDDPEGTAGVIAMQQAELDDKRFSSAFLTRAETPTASQTPPSPPPKDFGGDSDLAGFPAMDLGLMSGGYAGTLTYGDDVASPPRPGPNATDSTDTIPSFNADVDYVGTGGLQEPGPQRLSFDEGMESFDSRHSDSESPVPSEYQDLFYHPGISNRPLPALPTQSDPSMLAPTQSRPPYLAQSLSVDSRLAYGPDSINSPASQLSQQVERSISLVSHSNTPQVQAPVRSRTDAAEERRRQFRQFNGQSGQYEGYENTTAGGTLDYMIALPSGRKRKFAPSKLTPADIQRCREPWALSGIAAWIMEMAEGEFYLKAKDIEEALIQLFTSKVVTMHVADAEGLSARVVTLMLESGLLVTEEEWVKFGNGTLTGVLWQLTGHGCYAPKLHNVETLGRCYSRHCSRTLKKASLNDLGEVPKQEDWATFYGITKKVAESKPKKEVERQNILHEIVTSEESYMIQLEVLRVLYRDKLKTAQPAIITPNKMDRFLSAVFGKVDMVQTTNKDHLLAQLKYRQREQGPFIVGFSDLFREWIRKAKMAYIEYAAAFPYASYLIRKEASRNLHFSNFLEDVRNNKRSLRLDWTTYLKAPITRLQRYTFLLDTVRKNSKEENEELVNLNRAIDEIHAVTLECDQKVAEQQKEIEMMELNSMLVLRPGFHSMLHLDHLGRELILQGDLTRMGSKGVRWVDTHALLFDHYLILAKVVASKDARGDKKYDVSKEPIPMRLLFLESSNDDPVAKQKSIAVPLSRTTVATASGTQLNKMATAGGERPGIDHTNTNSSMTPVTRLAANATDESKILYPFRIKHLGHDIYTLYAANSQSRSDWCSAIIKAKERHAAALWSQNAEPFKLRVLADCSFAYDSSLAQAKPTAVPVKGTPLDRSIREMDEKYANPPKPRPSPVCRAMVNCATAFTAFGKHIIAIGTDYGVYISPTSDPRGWMRTVQIAKVTQIAVLEEFSVCLIISERSLISYPLDVVAPVSSYPGPVSDSARRAPTRLAKDVSFFATARMKDRMLVFFKRKEGLHNTFKVLEPVFQKSTEKRPRLFGGSRKGIAGQTETFRDFDEFYIPAECYTLNIFQTYIAISSAKGFEMLTLDKKQPMSIPDLKDPNIANVASRIRDLRPLGMFKLNEQEYLLAYEECAVYVDRHGDVSRTLIMEFSGKQRKARSATMCGPYLILFNDDYVEVRNAENGRLRQIIAGRDVRVLDLGLRGPTGGSGVVATSAGGAVPAAAAAAQDGAGWGQQAGYAGGVGGVQGLGLGMQASNPSKGTVKVAMAHPENPQLQIVLELVLNDGHAET